ncbi:apolipoprotein N-acyltransferase [Actinocorallia sp. API 0066]|uniref:apolipoprotein N-acyltransferase n=1 Tax=Actinocorallia sp. API 0066 TaxID=2896846 RepID=UPI001E2BEDC3|nr:apolipoprotein N-acyltransferase [Actinocorallia sp. API 0066]MCD0450750.1 apolipoprotein N-acyltransferase [Actinocorallia sp. API 0066]
MGWAFLAGVVPVLAFPGVGLWWLAWAAVVPGVLWARRADDVRGALRRGWAFGAGYIGAAMYWTAPNIGPALLLVAVGFGALWAPFGVAARVCRGWDGVLVLPAVWVAGEYLRSWHPFGGPWAVYGATQWESPEVLRLAAVGGVWLVSFVLVAVNAALALLITRLAAARVRAAPERGRGLLGRAKWWHGLAGVAAVGAAVAGVAGLTRGAGEAREEMTLALVQPGVVTGPEVRFAENERLSRTVEGADLIVWGESSVGFDLRSRPDLRERIADLGTVLVNEDARTPSGRISKSSVLYRDGTEADRYVKMRLVPFGEYIPLRPLFGWLAAISGAAAEDRVPGDGPAVFDVHGVRITPLVCFESAFPDLGRVAVADGARLIVVQSATSTFQESWAPAQHASLAAVRAAETGRPVVQAALTGVTAAFGPRGELLAWHGTDETGVFPVVVPLPDADARTPFTRIGDLIPLTCLLIVVSLRSRTWPGPGEKWVRAR